MRTHLGNNGQASSVKDKTVPRLLPKGIRLRPIISLLVGGVFFSVSCEAPPSPPPSTPATAFVLETSKGREIWLLRDSSDRNSQTDTVSLTNGCEEKVYNRKKLNKAAVRIIKPRKILSDLDYVREYVGYWCQSKPSSGLSRSWLLDHSTSLALNIVAMTEKEVTIDFQPHGGRGMVAIEYQRVGAEIMFSMRAGRGRGIAFREGNSFRFLSLSFVFQGDGTIAGTYSPFPEYIAKAYFVTRSD